MTRTSHIVFAVLILILAGEPSAGVSERAASGRQSMVAHFDRPTMVATEILEGAYLIIHDDTRAPHGDPCTAVYRLDPMGRAREEAVSFHCIPQRRAYVNNDKVTTRWDRMLGISVVTEYQFAGDDEGHGVPDYQLAANGQRSGFLVLGR